jgi:hypothetical protein
MWGIVLIPDFACQKRELRRMIDADDQRRRGLRRRRRFRRQWRNPAPRRSLYPRAERADPLTPLDPRDERQHDDPFGPPKLRASATASTAVARS